jgi:conjugal transfer pilus assembly protein TraW
MKRWLACLALSLSGSVSAMDTIGPTYLVTEPDMLDEITKNLETQERSGLLARKQREAITRSQASIEQPPAVEGLRNTVKPRSLYFDPTIVANQDVLDNEGRVVIAKGTKANPLDYVAMPQHLLFFNGDEPVQRKMAVAIDRHYDGRVKLIMTSGRVLSFSREMKKQVYFDQGGYLVAKLGIQQVPALVYQEGRVLRIDEMEAR